MESPSHQSDAKDPNDGKLIGSKDNPDTASKKSVMKERAIAASKGFKQRVLTAVQPKTHLSSAPPGAHKSTKQNKA